MDNSASGRMKALIKASQVLTQVDSLQELFPMLLTLAQQVTRGQGSSLLLFHPDDQSLSFALALNENETVSQIISQENIVLKLGEGIAGHVAKTLEPLLIADAQTDARFDQTADMASGFTTRSLLCAPIVYQNELLGAVQVVNAKDKNVFDTDDLEILSSFSYLAAMAIIRSRMLDQMIKQERFHAQLDAAARIQSHFWPEFPNLGNGCSVWAITQPAIVVGGDYHDCIALNDGAYLFCIADVSGKGLPAALAGAALWSKIRGLSSMADDLPQMLTRLDREMAAVMNFELFATLVLVYFDPGSCTASFCIAGHIPPLLISAGHVTAFDSMSGHPIGIDLDEPFTVENVQLKKGDSLLMMTDGVTEARNNKREMFGEDRLVALVGANTTMPYGPHIMNEIAAWTHNFEQNDDITVLEIYRL